MTRPLLLEIGTEDLPARYVVPLSTALTQGVLDGLSARGIACAAARSFATPRRIAVRIEGVASAQSTRQVERLGPAESAAFKDGQPTPAALGFARSCGVEFESLGRKDGKLHFVKTEPGRDTATLLQEIFEESLKRMDELVPKRMRWGSGEETFVRPVQWLCCLFGNEVVPLQRFGLTADRLTYGHRFHAPAAIALDAPADYEAALEKAHVRADTVARKTAIREQIETEARRLDAQVRITEDLLDEVTALVEWPVAIVGRFEERFLELPPEVIVATVETNQRYFTLFRDAAQTQLTNAFITLANIEARDGDYTQIVSGNERVVRPRLADALFFWQQDLRQPLSANVERLGEVTFQKELGSLGDKTARIAKLAESIAAQLHADVAAVARAAQLCKADLVSKMVFEFPELQGLMGGYYAERAGESAAVAQAIRSHYLPTQQGTPIPPTAEGRIVALADKLDTLAGIFAIGAKPTASKDPFALRRAALGVLRICLEAELPLDLRELLRVALEAQPAGNRSQVTLDELVGFVMERLRAHQLGSTLDGREISAEMFESVRAMDVTRPLDFQRRLRAVCAFLAQPAAPDLAAANKRVRNILRQADAVGADVDASLLRDAAERALAQRIDEVASRNAATSDYAEQLVNLASLREPVDAFFEAVMVNDPDAQIRANRLALLNRFDALCRSVADLSQLPG